MAMLYHKAPNFHDNFFRNKANYKSFITNFSLQYKSDLTHLLTTEYRKYHENLNKIPLMTKVWQISIEISLVA